VPDTERLLQHRLSPRRLAAVRALAVAGALASGALAYGVAAGRPSVLLLAAPTCSVLFLLLIATLAAFAEFGRVSWQFVCAVLAAGPALAPLLVHLLAPAPRR
jgi:hypothetical protein